MTMGSKTLFSTYMRGLNYRLQMKMDDVCRELEVINYPGKKYEIVYVSGETYDLTVLYCPYIKYNY